LQRQQRIGSALDGEVGINLGIGVHARIDLAIEAGYDHRRRCVATGQCEHRRYRIADHELPDGSLLLSSALRADSIALPGQSGCARQIGRQPENQADQRQNHGGAEELACNFQSGSFTTAKDCELKLQFMRGQGCLG